MQTPTGPTFYLLANIVVHGTEDTNSTGGESNELPGEVATRMLLVSAEAQTGANQGCDGGVGEEDRVGSVVADTTGLRLAGLGLLLRFFALALLLLLGLALYPLGLGAGLHVLLEEVGFDSLDVRAVDVDQRSCALRFIVVNSTDGGSAAVHVLVEIGGKFKQRVLTPATC